MRVKSEAKAPKLNLRQRRTNARQVQRFTRESRFGKIFIRSLIGSIAALTLFVLSTMFTPLLAIDKITVVGNSHVPTKQIQAALKHRLGGSLTMISDTAVADDLKQFKLIESISLQSQPPHTLVVRISERSAIAIVVRGGTRFLFDPAGVNLGKATGNELVPTILVSDDPKTSQNYAQAIDVLLALPAQLLTRVAYIQAKSKDNVTLQLRGYSAQTIIWGDSSQSILKSKVLKALLSRTSRTARATFDVSSPLTPSVIH
jgi:cell division protein FtsQ